MIKGEAISSTKWVSVRGINDIAEDAIRAVDVVGVDPVVAVAIITVDVGPR